MKNFIRSLFAWWMLAGWTVVWVGGDGCQHRRVFPKKAQAVQFIEELTACWEDF